MVITTKIQTSYFYKQILWYRHTFTETTELNFFTDSSNQAYGVIVYLRSTLNSGDVKVSFVLGKSRLAPIKENVC